MNEETTKSAENRNFKDAADRIGSMGASKQKKRALPFIIVAAVALITVTVGIGIYNSPTNRIQRQLDLGYKYLEEENYEQAIVEFDKAIAIDPMSVETLDALENTYLAYAQSVVDTGDLENAVSILEEGYAKTGREELYNKMQELQEIIEEAKAEEIRQLVQGKWNEISPLLMLYHKYVSGGIHISDARFKESCRQYIDILEQYKAAFTDDYFYWRTLWNFYYVLGEYELCMETRKQLYELTGDEEYSPEGYTIHDEGPSGEGRYVYYDAFYDEYGRIISRIGGEQELIHYTYDEKYQYGDNGKMVMFTEHQYFSDLDRPDIIYIRTFEYDLEGRISKEIRTYQHTDGFIREIMTFTYAYGENGFTEHYRDERFFDYDDNHYLLSSASEHNQDYQLNEYGEDREIGDRYNEVFEHVDR